MLRKPLLTALFLGAICQLLLAQPNAASRYDRIRVDLRQHNLSELAALGLEVDHGEYVPGRSFSNDYSEEELLQLVAAGIEFEVLIRDVSAYYVERSQESFAPAVGRGPGNCEEDDPGMAMGNYQIPSRFRLGTMAGFYTYQDVLNILDSMRLAYPDLITSRRTIPNAITAEGRPIYWLRISDNPDTDESAEPEVLYTALHHAREPNSLTQMVFYMWYLLENYATDPEVQYLVQNTEMYFIPILNPDGYIYNEAIAPDGGGLWRKNRRITSDSTIGVDLNRNYGFAWGHDNLGSSPNPVSSVYRGDGPFSEAETSAVRDFCDMHSFQVALNYHTHGNLLIYPWGFLDAPTPDSATFENLAEMMTLQNDYVAGTGTETVGYVVNGDSDDWMYGEVNSKPAIFAMTPEVGNSGPGGGFWPVIENIIPNCLASMWMNLVSANAPHVAGVLQTDPGQFTLPPGAPHLRFSLQRYGLTDGTLTASLTALDPVVTVLDPPKAYELDLNEERQDSFALSIDPNMATGTELFFVLSLDNGSYLHVDTVRYIYSNLLATTNYADPLSDIDSWDETNSNWGLTTEAFVSEPTSLTDSPDELYPNGSNNQITLDNPIILNEGEGYQLRFWARWNIETFYDYAQVQIEINGGAWIPLCGLYTVEGSDLQDAGEPVYEGEQLEWVQEEIDLTPIVQEGDQIRLRFLLRADGFLNFEGFFVDDLVVEELQAGGTTNTNFLAADEFSVSVLPNPSILPPLIRFELPNFTDGTLHWQLQQTDGRVVDVGLVELIDNQAAVRLEHALPAGVYWLSASIKGQRLPAQKVIIF